MCVISQGIRAASQEPALGEMSEFKAAPPAGIDPIGASSEGASLYELIREDIIEGRLKPNERLVVADLARRHGTSTNPVREALQLLRGEGFVIFAPNRGARVRPIDQDFVRDIYEIGVLIEPALTRWFVGMATRRGHRRTRTHPGPDRRKQLRRPVHGTASSTPPSTPSCTSGTTTATPPSCGGSIARCCAPSAGASISRSRGAPQIMREHRELIALIKAGDADKAAELIARHVEGSGRHILEQMRARSAARAG